MRQKMAEMVHRIQDEICQALREIDGVDYRQDEWTRAEGGGGRPADTDVSTQIAGLNITSLPTGPSIPAHVEKFL